MHLLAKCGCVGWLGILCMASMTALAQKPTEFPRSDLARVDFRYAPAWWQTAICLPDDWQKTLVGRDGCLLYDYPGKFADFKTRIRANIEGAEWVKQELASPRIPIVRTMKRAGSVEIVEEAFALPVKSTGKLKQIVERVGSQTVLTDWAQPSSPCDPAFRHIAVGYGQPVHYRFRVERSARCLVVFGLCEGYHSDAGSRILDLQVEGKTVRTIDPIAEKGRNAPILIPCEAVDENGDGFIDVAVAASAASPDGNAFLNALWVFPADAQPDLAGLENGSSGTKPMAFVSCGQDALAPTVRSDVMVVTYRNTGQDDQAVVPALTVDSESAVRVSDDRTSARIGQVTTVLFPVKVDRCDPTENGAKLAFSSVSLRPGQTYTLAIRVARGEEAATQHIDLRRTDRLRRDAERFWERSKLPYGCIEVPDAGIQALLDSSIRNIYQAREIKNGLPAFQVGPTCYRGLWVVDGSFLLEAVTFLGRAYEARKGFEYLLSFQREDGGFSLMDGHWKETGIALWAVTRHARLTGDKRWLESVWPRVEKGFEFIRSMRKAASQDSGALNCGLIPEGFSDGGLGGKYPEYTNIYWTLAGMNSAVNAARWLGKKATAGEWQREYDDMMSTFRKAAARDTRDDSHGNRFVPIRMRDDQNVAPQKGQWAFLHALYPGEVFRPDDELVRGNMAMLEAVEDEGLVHGTGWLNEGIWNYFGSFYAHAWLWAGRGDKAAQVLYAFANHASPLLTWREEQMPVGKGSQICGDMPHNWASAEMIRLVRHLLVLERGDELHLLEGLPSDWVRPSGTIRLKNIATEFGPLSVSLTVSSNGQKAVFKLEGAHRTPPARILLHLGKWAANPGLLEMPVYGRVSLDIPLAGRVAR